MEEDDWKPLKAYHRICIRHFASNFNIKVKCMAKKALLTSIGYENQQIKFCNRFKELKELLKDNQDALKWLVKLNAEKWALSYDIGVISGCAILLQLWAWEYLITGRPRKLAVPAPPPSSDIDPMRLLALGYKWNVPKSFMQTSHHVLMLYRDLLD
ncbi:hypothetical protein QQ045_031238 [Rhodiola kirilowii]